MHASSAIIAQMGALSRDEMQALQLAKLRSQIERLHATSGFYRERWDKAGVRLDDIRTLLQSGADKVSINTAAVHRREFVKEAAEKFGDQCIVVAIDAKRVARPAGGRAWPAA